MTTSDDTNGVLAKFHLIFGVAAFCMTQIGDLAELSLAYLY